MTTIDTDHEPEEPSRADLLAQVEVLQGRLARLPAIEQAKGALMATYGLTADAAFDLLRFHSQTGNVKIRALAAHLTTLLSTLPTSDEAIARFDRLLADATGLLRIAARGERPDAVGGPEAAVTPAITIAAHAPDQPLVYANDAFTKLTGYSLDEVAGRNCRFLQGAATDPRDTATIRRALGRGQPVSVVLTNYRRDGTPFRNEVSISPIRNRRQQLTHYVGTQSDVTDRARPDGVIDRPAGWRF